jgi:F-type H+-transporting ATPase subunit a
MKFLPLLMSIFFFILGLNLFGQVPFFGSTNVTGNLTLTMVLALIVFFVVNFNGKKDYWKHIFWMPDVPAFVKVILTPVEVMGMFIKPSDTDAASCRKYLSRPYSYPQFYRFDIHIWQIGCKYGRQCHWYDDGYTIDSFYDGYRIDSGICSGFVFTILTASYIGAAIEEHHHADHHAEGHH